MQPGWRVRVVAPVVATGGYLVKTELTKAPDVDDGQADSSRPATSEVTLSAPELIGYEVSLYSVKPRREGGVAVVFQSEQVHRQGKVTTSHHPIEPLFRLPPDAGYVRILHLARVKQDYDSAVLAASRKDALETLTRRVEADPKACKTEQVVYCSWIPRGIAAIPEARNDAANGGEWQAAF